MDPETVESASSASAAETASQPDLDRAVAPEQPALDPGALVARMIEAGEWPEPELIEQIVRAGDAAVEPLMAILHSRPRGWPAEASLDLAIGLLSMIRPPTAIPELIEVLRCYDNEIATSAAFALADFGDRGFDALAELCRDSSIVGHQRYCIIQCASDAAGYDPARKSQIAVVLRSILDDLIARAREELKKNGYLPKHPPDEIDDEDDDLDDEDDDLDEIDDVIDDDSFDEGEELGDDSFDEGEEPGAEPLEDELLSNDDDFVGDDSEEDEHEPVLYTAEELGNVVYTLANLADPLALDSIRTAFREGLVDESVVYEGYVDKCYAASAEPAETEPESDWLGRYCEDYAEHVEELNRPPTPPPIDLHRPKYRYADRYLEQPPPPDIPATLPIRNTGPKLGRNDPCWCGSGKKYKKCHLGKDAPAEPDR